MVIMSGSTCRRSSRNPRRLSQRPFTVSVQQFDDHPLDYFVASIAGGTERVRKNTREMLPPTRRALTAVQRRTDPVLTASPVVGRTRPVRIAPTAILSKTTTPFRYRWSSGSILIGRQLRRYRCRDMAAQCARNDPEWSSPGRHGIVSLLGGDIGSGPPGVTPPVVEEPIVGGR